MAKDNLLTGQSKYGLTWGCLDTSKLDNAEFKTNMVYDALNSPIEITYPQDMSGGRKKVHPEYNKAGALEKLKFAGAAAVSRIAYNAKGQRTMMVAGGLMTRYAYDNESFRLTRIRAQKYTQSGATFSPNGNVRLDRGYSYDLMGSVTKVHDKTPGDAASRGPNDEEWIYQHDPLRRLISATGREHSIAFAAPPWENNVKGEDPGQTNTYTRKYIYDKQGNILELDHKADLVTGQDFTREFNYGTGTQSNRLQSFDVTSNNYSYSYDANGNLLQENSDRYFEWNYADKLAFFKRQAGAGNPSVWVHYLYDNNGTRIKKIVNKAGGIQEVTVYIDGMYEYSYTKNSGAFDSNGRYNNLHVMADSSKIATVRVGTDIDANNANIPTQLFYVEDHLGNASVVVQTNGNRFNLEEYYPFGETSFGSYAKKRYRYNGKEKDEHTGLYEYGQRYYAPWLCRFVSVDPVAEKFADLSSYNYAGNKPMTKVDQEGLQEEDRRPTNGNQPMSNANSQNNTQVTELPTVEVVGVKGSDDTEIMEADALSLDLANADLLSKEGTGSDLQGSLIEMVFDDVVSMLTELDRLLYPDGGLRLTSDNASSTDGGSIKRNYDSSMDVTWIQDVLTGLGKNPKALNGSRIDKILGGLESLTGAVNEVADNKELILQKIEDVQEILKGVAEGSQENGVEYAGDAPKVDFFDLPDDSVTIEYDRSIKFYYPSGTSGGWGGTRYEPDTITISRRTFQDSIYFNQKLLK